MLPTAIARHHAVASCHRLDSCRLASVGRASCGCCCWRLCMRRSESCHARCRCHPCTLLLLLLLLPPMHAAADADAAATRTPASAAAFCSCHCRSLWHCCRLRLPLPFCLLGLSSPASTVSPTLQCRDAAFAAHKLMPHLPLTLTFMQTPWWYRNRCCLMLKPNVCAGAFLILCFNSHTC